MEEKSHKVWSGVLHEEPGGQSKGMPARCQGWTAPQRGPCVQLPNLHVAVMGPSWWWDGQIHPLSGHIFRGESNPSLWCVRAVDALVHHRGWGAVWRGGDRVRHMQSAWVPLLGCAGAAPPSHLACVGAWC